MFELMDLVQAAMIIPMTTGIVEVLKRLFDWAGWKLPSAVLPVVSLVIAEGASLLAIGVSAQGFLAGIVGGLAACGLWDFPGKQVVGKVLGVMVVMLVLSAASADAGQSVRSFAWDAVTTNTDGTPCVDLEGYDLHCGLSSRAYTLMKDVGNVTITPIEVILSGQPDGIYFCTVTARDIWGNASDYANEVAVAVRQGNFSAPGAASPSAPGTFRTE